MNARTTFAALSAGLVLVAVPATALAGGRPQAMSPVAYRSLVAQGQAMNARYGNSVTKLSSQQFAELWRDGGSKLSPQALDALVVRGQAMNEAASGQSAYVRLEAVGKALNARYGNEVTKLSPQQFIELYNAGGSKLSPAALNAILVRGEAMNKLAASAGAGRGTTSGTSSFAWGEFGIGIAAAVGLILLLGGLGVAVRTGRRTGVATRIG